MLVGVTPRRPRLYTQRKQNKKNANFRRVTVARHRHECLEVRRPQPRQKQFIKWARVFFARRLLQLNSWLAQRNASWKYKCREIEADLDVQVDFSISNEEESASTRVRIHTCTDDAAMRIAAAQECNGFEMWILRWTANLAQSPADALPSQMYSKFTSKDPRATDDSQHFSHFSRLLPISLSSLDLQVILPHVLGFLGVSYMEGCFVWVLCMLPVVS